MRNLWNEKHVKCVLFIIIISVHVQVTSTSLSAVQFKDQNGSANQSIAIPGIIILLSYSSKLIVQWSTKQIPLNWTHVPDTWTCGDTRGNNSHLGGSWFLKWPNQWPVTRPGAGVSKADTLICLEFGTLLQNWHKLEFNHESINGIFIVQNE